MGTPPVTFVFAGERFPISPETGDRIIEFVAAAEADSIAADHFVVPTVDGRQVIANIGPSMPYAIEIGIEDHSPEPGESQPDGDLVQTLAARDSVLQHDS
ncbi:hypothetical protein [Gordonia zhaorongruii]|uniref:hypothetical protein n=1 Tax=Gordonia zhaorongruii TaxID=2597659 RepID=UPI00104665F3|nr:hypothetical protein [Gordonia zhaorongruii]